MEVALWVKIHFPTRVSVSLEETCYSQDSEEKKPGDPNFFVLGTQSSKCQNIPLGYSQSEVEHVE
jgi:hypothetical protein